MRLVNEDFDLFCHQRWWSVTSSTHIMPASSKPEKDRPWLDGVLAEAVPGVFTYLGTGNETAGSIHGLHTPKFILDESVLPLGAALHVAMAFQVLGSYQTANIEKLWQALPSVLHKAVSLIKQLGFDSTLQTNEQLSSCLPGTYPILLHFDLSDIHQPPHFENQVGLDHGGAVQKYTILHSEVAPRI